MKVLICLSVFACASAGPLNNTITAVTNLGTDLGKKTADAVNGTVHLGADVVKGSSDAVLDASKIVVTDMSKVGTQALDDVKSVGHNVIDMLGVVGDSLGAAGKPLIVVEDIASNLLDKGVNAGKDVISTSESAGVKGINAADIVVTITADTAKNAANSGTEVAKGTLEAIKYGILNFFG